MQAEYRNKEKNLISLISLEIIKYFKSRFQS